MKTKLFPCLCILLLFSGTGFSQLSEHFDAGNLSLNPIWMGDTADFTVNPDHQLQSKNTVTGSSFYLSTSNQLTGAVQWEIFVKLNFNTSSANYTDIYLSSALSNLLLAGNTGYFIRLGGTTDEISLYRKDGTSSTKIIDGADGILNSSSNTLKLKVIRNSLNQFSIFRDQSGTGNNYVADGTVTDATYTNATFFGIAIKQSTAGFFQQHFFDDIEIGPYIPDITPPAILSANAINPNSLDILFSEPLGLSSSENPTNYFADHSVGFPVTALLDITNKSLVHLSFLTPFPNGVNCMIQINGVEDISGNAIINGSANFVYYSAQQYDIVIDEIMADPNPPKGLPSVEWLELKNTSAFPINLKNWKIGDVTDTSNTFPPVILQPDSFLIICGSGGTASMQAYGRTMTVVNFPSLNDDKDELLLLNDSGKVIHAVNYTHQWYKNELKQSGGWTLEMIDTKNPCSGFSNWKASTDNKGGTPAKLNTADTVNEDTDGPRLLRAFAADSVHITLVFDEPVDIVQSVQTANFLVSDGIGSPQDAAAISPFFDKLVLQLGVPLVRGKIFSVTVSNITDCKGNTIRGNKNIRVGLSEFSDSGDIIINEVMFDPPPDGKDYVELYNRSKKIIDLNQLYIANRSLQQEISNITPLSKDHILLFPEEYMVISEDPLWVKKQYLSLHPDVFIELPLMPSFNNDKGNVILLNAQGRICDELAYSDQWHFKLIDYPEAISLERIDPNAVTQSENNWHSAATSAGYGTPTYKNSQFRMNDGVGGEVNLLPEIISPDNDGRDDYATISYHFSQPGYVANLTVFDVQGRPVRYLRQNELCGTTGSILWDGMGEKFKPLPVGIYILLTEIFNLTGNKKQFKNVIVLAGKN